MKSYRIPLADSCYISYPNVASIILALVDPYYVIVPSPFNLSCHATVLRHYLKKLLCFSITDLFLVQTLPIRTEYDSSGFCPNTSIHRTVLECQRSAIDCTLSSFFCHSKFLKFLNHSTYLLNVSVFFSLSTLFSGTQFEKYEFRS